MCGALVLSACALQPATVRPIPTAKPFATYDCARLDAEARTLEEKLGAVVGSKKAGTRKALGILRGEVDAVNDAIATQGCKVAPAKLMPAKRT